MSNGIRPSIILVEGDTEIAQMNCGQCGQFFRGNLKRVVSHNNTPFCLDCVEAAQPIRKERGLEPIKVVPGAYL